MHSQETAVAASATVPQKNALIAGLRRYSRSPTGLAGASLVLLVFLAAILAPWLAPWDQREVDLLNVLGSPSRAHLLGTDELGRDVLSRVIHGARPALIVSLSAVALAMLIGVPLGMAAGYFRGKVDTVIGRVVDAFLAFPTLILALAVNAMLGAGLVTTIVSLGVASWPGFSRLVRGQTLSLRERDWVTAARALGSNSPRILFLHIAPNLVSVIIVVSSINLAGYILAEAGLSFLGLGVPPPAVSWGRMLRTGYPFLESSFWPAVVPGMAIFITVLGFNLLGDGLRDFLDPRLRQK
ncbi:MAG: ABC transporter permease [Dehalococcoidia bacterium]|nr:ABC transporter permease [Dehalococcoidia bacterium]